MNRFRWPAFVVLVGMSLAALAGCEDQPIVIAYERPARSPIPAGIRRIAIAEFGGKTAEEKRFGDIASDLLASRLHERNKEFGRYELVDRKRLRVILDEQDLQLAISDTATASKVGKIADVQAIVYGSVTVSTKTERGSRMGFDIRTRRPKTVYYTKRTCLVSVNFTMDDIRTAKTIVPLTFTEEYDSDKDKKKGGRESLTKALGFSADKPPPADQVYGRLIEECVERFVREISPHTVEVTVKMEAGKSRIVKTGNKLARAGDYGEALECYGRALESCRDDDGAAFNAGLMHEAMGRLEEAEKFYGRAFELKDKEKYVLARRRVRMEAIR